MAIALEAVYEDGVLKPDQPLPFAEHERVKLTVDRAAPPTQAFKPFSRPYPMLQWHGDDETLRRLAIDPEFDPQESA